MRRHFTHDAAAVFHRTGLDRPEAAPGLVVSVHVSGDAVNPQLPLHMVATDGAIDHEGSHHLPVRPDDARCLERLFAARVLDWLVAADRLTPLFREQRPRGSSLPARRTPVRGSIVRATTAPARTIRVD